MVKAGNEMIEAERLRDPQKAKQMDAMLQAHINEPPGTESRFRPRPARAAQPRRRPQGKQERLQTQNNLPLTPKQQ